MAGTAGCDTLANFQAAVAAGDWGRVLPALALGPPGREQCQCGMKPCEEKRPQRSVCKAVQQALGELGGRAAAGQLPLARGTLASLSRASRGEK